MIRTVPVWLLAPTCHHARSSTFAASTQTVSVAPCAMVGNGRIVEVDTDDVGVGEFALDGDC